MEVEAHGGGVMEEGRMEMEAHGEEVLMELEAHSGGVMESSPPPSPDPSSQQACLQLHSVLAAMGYNTSGLGQGGHSGFA